MTYAHRLRLEARELAALGERLYRESDELLERSRLVKAEARRLLAEAEAEEDRMEAERVSGQAVRLGRRRAA